MIWLHICLITSGTDVFCEDYRFIIFRYTVYFNELEIISQLKGNVWSKFISILKDVGINKANI